VQNLLCHAAGGMPHLHSDDWAKLTLIVATFAFARFVFGRV